MLPSITSSPKMQIKLRNFNEPLSAVKKRRQNVSSFDDASFAFVFKSLNASPSIATLQPQIYREQSMYKKLANMRSRANNLQTIDREPSVVKSLMV